MVRNAGNSIDSYNLSFVDWNASWVHYIVPESLTLFPEEDGKANVTVLVPSDLGDSPLPAYAFDLRVESVNGDAERLLALTVAITPYGRLEWLWDGEPVTSPGVPVAANGTLRPKPIIEVYAGTLATLDLRLRNAGVIEDNVTLWAWSPDPLVNVTVRPGGGTVRVGGTMDVYLEISVPDNLSPGEHRVWVNASSSDGRQAPRAVPVEFDIIPYYDGFDFAGLSWDDPLGDEFAYTYRLEADRVASSRGRRAGHADLDILTLTAVLDPATNVVTLTVELKGAPTDDRGVFYGVYFVTEDHQVVGGLVDPRSHEAGDLVWESHDEANTLASMYVSDGQLGSSVPMPSLGVTLGADRVVFTVHADDLRRAGVEPGSGFLVYAYCHRLGAPDEGGGTRLVYDTAGQGAVTGPWEFTDEPEEASSMALVVIAAVAVVAALAVLFVLFVIPRLTPPVPDEEPDEADDWVEFK
jgi:hypothetical protein